VVILGPELDQFFTVGGVLICGFSSVFAVLGLIIVFLGLGYFGQRFELLGGNSNKRGDLDW
jgi:hypothetical protein